MGLLENVMLFFRETVAAPWRAWLPMAAVLLSVLPSRAQDLPEQLNISLGSFSSSLTKGDDGYYEIGSAAELVEFASIVNGTGTTTEKELNACARVTADIDFTAANDVTFTPIGGDNVIYAGTFDGGGHTITLNINNTSANWQGLFGQVGNCTITNVTVAGSITGKNYVGGIVGMVRSNDTGTTTTITNCHNKATVTGSGTGDDGRCVGGIIGIVNNEIAESGTTKYKGGTVTVSYCSNTGAVTGSATSGKVGGIIGYVSVQTTISYCMNSGAISATASMGSLIGNFTPKNYTEVPEIALSNCYNSYQSSSLAAIGYGRYAVINCYDINGRNGMTSFTTDELKDGTLCYKLNGSKAVSKDCWYQKIGTDTIPVLTAEADSSNVVNKATKTKLGETIGTVVYFNSVGSGCSINTDTTAFYVLSDIDATDKAKNNLKNGTEEGLINVLYSDGGSYYCANAVLKDKTEYNVNIAYTAAHFTYNRTLANSGIYTFILPAKISADNVNGTVYKLSNYEDETLKFCEVTGELTANTPYLVNTSEAEKNLLKGTLTDVPVSAMTAESVTVGNATHIGSYTSQSINTGSVTNATYYAYSGGKFVKATGTCKLPPFRTIIKVTSSSPVKSLGLQLGDEVTGIVSLALQSMPVDVYTLSGVKVRSQTDTATALQGLPMGIYIVGGKKVVKK